GLGIEGSWNEYLMEEERYVRNAKLHHKNLLLIYRSRNNWEIKAGLHHFVQWGGISSGFGQISESFENYLSVISGGKGNEETTLNDQVNAIGNHLGGYEFFITKTFNHLYVE